MKIAAMTVCCVDIYPQQNILRVGGESLNFATQCRRSGVEEVSVIGCVGTDRYGAMVIDHLKGMGIDTSHLYARGEPTATNRIYITETGERTFRPDSWQNSLCASSCMIMPGKVSMDIRIPGMNITHLFETGTGSLKNIAGHTTLFGQAVILCPTCSRRYPAPRISSAPSRRSGTAQRSF